jgi:hypothetical protein
MAFFSVEKTKPLLGNLIDLIWQNNNDSYFFFSSRGFHIDILLFVGYTYNLANMINVSYKYLHVIFFFKVTVSR